METFGFMNNTDEVKISTNNKQEEDPNWYLTVGYTWKANTYCTVLFRYRACVSPWHSYFNLFLTSPPTSWKWQTKWCTPSLSQNNTPHMCALKESLVAVIVLPLHVGRELIISESHCNPRGEEKIHSENYIRLQKSESYQMGFFLFFFLTIVLFV